MFEYVAQPLVLHKEVIAEVPYSNAGASTLDLGALMSDTERAGKFHDRTMPRGRSIGNTLAHAHSLRDCHYMSAARSDSTRMSLRTWILYGLLHRLCSKCSWVDVLTSTSSKLSGDRRATIAILGSGPV